MESFEEELAKLVSETEITPEDFEARKLICRKLKEWIPGVRSVHQFGSSINELGFRGCDLDVYVNMGNCNIFIPSS